MEWKSIVSKVKAHEQFKNYNLIQVIGISRTHESEVMEDVKVVSKPGPLALVAKGDIVKEKKPKVINSNVDETDDEFTYREKALTVSNPKKIQEKPCKI